MKEKTFTVILFFAFFLSLVAGNWLHQCSPCVDQALYSDMSLKTDIRPANSSTLYEQLKQMQVRQFEHVEKEFFNRFFSRSQLGIIAQELQAVCPEAVSLIPERRYTSANGTQASERNVLMVRESHILFVLVGAAQELARKLDVMDGDYWTRAASWDVSLGAVQGAVGGLQVAGQKMGEKVENSYLKISHLTQQWETLYTAVRVAEDRVGEVRVGLVGLTDSVSRDLSAVHADLRRMDTDHMKFTLQAGMDMESLREQLAVVWKAVRVLETQNLNERLSRVESKVFEFTNFLFQTVPSVETQAKVRQADATVERVKLLLQLQSKRYAQLDKAVGEEAKRNHQISMLLETVGAKLAQQREEFDKQLVLLKEASSLRILREKGVLDTAAAERQLQFEREKLDVELAVRMEQARIDSESKLKDKRENEDINLRELGEKNQAEKEKVLLLLKESAKIFSEWISQLFGNFENLAVAIGSLLVVVAGVFIAKEGSGLLRQEIARRLGKPDLIRESSRKGFFSYFFAKISTKNEFNDVVLNTRLMEHIRRLAMATKSAHVSRLPLLNAMFYGEPGTGKTMVAKRFAEFSGLDYAIMSGGDIAPLGADAVTEIHRLFQWVASSRRGVLLFIDEAESFLNQRSSGMSENLRNAITAFLFHTGTASSKFMLVIATNRPGDLDSAIIDRIDERIEFPLPHLGEREQLVKMYYDKFLVSADAEGLEAQLRLTAKQTKGFSGREISKLMMAVSTASRFGTHASAASVLSQVTTQKVKEHETILNMKLGGYCFDRSTLDKDEGETEDASCNEGVIVNQESEK